MTYYWDFFGPDSSTTAEHFNRHLATFLTTLSLADCTHGTLSLEDNHCAAWCTTTNPASCQAIEQRLRPRRKDDA